MFFKPHLNFSVLYHRQQSALPVPAPAPTPQVQYVPVTVDQIPRFLSPAGYPADPRFISVNLGTYADLGFATCFLLQKYKKSKSQVCLANPALVDTAKCKLPLDVCLDNPSLLPLLGCSGGIHFLFLGALIILSELDKCTVTRLGDGLPLQVCLDFPKLLTSPACQGWTLVSTAKSANESKTKFSFVCPPLQNYVCPFLQTAPFLTLLNIVPRTLDLS